MRDYLEELLNLLPPLEEDEAEGWPETPSLPRSTWGRGDETEPWRELRGPELESLDQLPASDPAGTPVLDWEGAAPLWTEAKGYLPISRWNTAPEEYFGGATGGGDGTSLPSLDLDVGAAGGVLAVQNQSRRRPALLVESQRLERAAMQAGTLIARRQSRAAPPSALAGPRPAGGWEAPQLDGGGTGRGRTGAWETLSEDGQARLLDKTFQRDSRRYDRGFSLY